MSNLVIYRVRNDDSQDLDALVIYRPRVLASAGVPDGIKYPLAVTGKGDFAHDEINLGFLGSGTNVARGLLRLASERGRGGSDR